MLNWKRHRRQQSEHQLFPFTESIDQLSGNNREYPRGASLFDQAQPFAHLLNRSLGPNIAMKRFRIALALVFVTVSVFAVRAAELQLWEGESYRDIAEGNRLRMETTPAVRGTVTDRFGNVLIENIPTFTLVLRMEDLPEDTSTREEVFQRITDLAGLQRADLDLLLQEYRDTNFADIIVRRDMDRTNALLTMVEEYRLPGFFVDVRTRRQYTTRALSLSHVLGYMGKITAEEYEALAENSTYLRTDEIGRTGVEKSLEQVLRGEPGRKLIEVDAYGAETTIYAQTAATDGSEAILSIDLDLQVEMEKRLIEALEETGARQASAVAMDPQTGEILALVSLPAFDNNLFAKGIDQEVYTRLASDPLQPLFPRAIAGEFPSGSTFKPFVAAAALAEGLITPTTSFLSIGGISVGPWFFPDWRAGGHGMTDVRKAIAESVNTFFYIIGGGYDTFQGLGVERITTSAREFGFGAITGINLPGEADGFLPSKIWKEETKGERWYVGDTYHLAIGQGDLLATPLQMAVSTATIANGGTRFTPTVVREIADQKQTTTFYELPLNLVRAIETVSEGMRQAVTQGSARSLSALPFEVAAKTGTAQTSETNITHAWFTGFAPYEQPEIVLTILIEKGGEGSSTAVPVARDIFTWWGQQRMDVPLAG